MNVARHALRRASNQWYGTVIGACFVFVFLASVAFAPRGFFASVREDVLLVFNPSTDRMYAYAESHFSAEHSRTYDIDRAETLFKRVLAAQPDYPFVNHELARIAFLRGDFDFALALLERELRTNPNPSPSTYYVRGLVLGYSGRYDEAAESYALYLKSDPRNWAATTDYAWVLIKADRAEEARDTLASYLTDVWPEGNAWLWNAYAIALFETGEPKDAYVAIQKASSMIDAVTVRDWLVAYPGNDPRIADEGIETLKRSIAENMHTIGEAVRGGAVQSP